MTNLSVCCLDEEGTDIKLRKPINICVTLPLKGLPSNDKLCGSTTTSRVQRGMQQEKERAGGSQRVAKPQRHQTI